MKLFLALAFALTSTLAFADDNAATTAEPSSTPMTKENVSATAKKRLRHVGKNIETLGHKAGHKLGIKKTGEETTPNDQPAASATPWSDVD